MMKSADGPGPSPPGAATRDSVLARLEAMKASKGTASKAPKEDELAEFGLIAAGAKEGEEVGAKEGGTPADDAWAPPRDKWDHPSEEPIPVATVDEEESSRTSGKASFWAQAR